MTGAQAPPPTRGVVARGRAARFNAAARTGLAGDGGQSQLDMDSLTQDAPGPIDPTTPGSSVAPCYTIHAPPEQTLPLVFASAHSGRAYTPEFVATARLDELTLRRSEDSYVDEIFAAIPALGAPLLAASFPRAFCDVNREAWELDPAMFEDALPPWVNTTSPRVGAGFGTIARVVANGEAIYGIRLRFAEAERRVRGYWEPYHAALAALVEATLERFGVCVLVDCHSMPSSATATLAPPPDGRAGRRVRCQPVPRRWCAAWKRSLPGTAI
ncbi:MAG: N-formylglutamate amidohydrolase [Rhodospirillales bacterium]